MMKKEVLQGYNLTVFAFPTKGNRENSQGGYSDVAHVSRLVWCKYYSLS